MKPKVRQITVIIRDDTFKHLTRIAAKKGYKKLGMAIDDLVRDNILCNMYDAYKGYREKK